MHRGKQNNIIIACVCVCLYIRYRRPHRLPSRAVIWHRYTFPTTDCAAKLSTPYPHPWGQGALKRGYGVRTAQTECFCENFIKQKLNGTPVNGGQLRSDQFPTSPRCPAAGPSARVALAAMVPWPFKLKYGREVGNYPGRSMLMFGLGTPTPGSGEPYKRVSKVHAAKIRWV